MDSKGYWILGRQELAATACGPKAIRQNQLKLEGNYLIPDGLVVPYDKFEWLIGTSGINTTDTFEEVVKSIQGASKVVSFLQSLLDVFSEDRTLILRTAASTEDNPQQTNTGQFTSPAGIQSLANLQHAIAEVWMTALSNGNTARLSLLLQEYLPADLGGITFTVSPTQPDPEVIVFEVAQGPCERLTSGATPEAKFEYNWHESQLIGTIPESLHSVISEIQLQEAGKTFLRLQQMFGYPLDIEWGIINSALYIYQCRPITRLAFPSDTVWTNANFRDGGIGANMPSPLMWDLYKTTFDFSVDAFARRYHLIPEPFPKAWSKTYLGYPYWNLAATKSGASKVLGYVERQFDQGQGVTHYYEGDGETSTLTFKRLYISIKALLAIRKSIRNRFTVCAETKQYFEEIVKPEYEALATASSPTQSVAPYFKRLIDEHLMFVYTNYWEIIYDNTFVSTFTQNAIDRYNRRTGSQLQFTDVTAELSQIAHLRPLTAIQQFAEQIGTNKETSTWWGTNNPKNILQFWQEGAVFPERDGFAELLKAVGYKSAHELEVLVPNWSEAPLPVIEAIQQYLLKPLQEPQNQTSSDYHS
ncbi:MAG: hypothetical protein KI786_05180, partial [Mameliella sp.]|nr:hypothetical protein [Phaeodactylibacter sp.]